MTIGIVEEKPVEALPGTEETIQVELPPDLLPPKEGEEEPAKPDELKPGEVETEGQPPAKPPRGFVPTGALHAERRKRQDAVGLYEHAESERKKFEEDLARIRREQAGKPVEKVRPDYNAMDDLNVAMQAHDKEWEEKLDAERAVLRSENLTRIVSLTEDIARMTYEDYDDALKRASVLVDITPDAVTGAVKDPFLRQWIYSQPNPAQAAYDYAKGRLSKEDQAAAEVRGEAKGRAEVVKTIVKNAERPRGIANLPSSTASQGGITRRDIDRMTDMQKARLKKERPEVWKWYLGGD